MGRTLLVVTWNGRPVEWLRRELVLPRSAGGQWGGGSIFRVAAESLPQHADDLRVQAAVLLAGEFAQLCEQALRNTERQRLRGFVGLRLSRQRFKHTRILTYAVPCCKS